MHPNIYIYIYIYIYLPSYIGLLSYIHTYTYIITHKPLDLFYSKVMANCRLTQLTGHSEGESHCKAGLKLLKSVIFDSQHILRPIFPPIFSRRPGLRNRFRPFDLSIKFHLARTLYIESSLSPLFPKQPHVVFSQGSIVVADCSLFKLEFCYHCIICICG